VGFALVLGMMPVRDSRDPPRPVLRSTPSEVAAWPDGARRHDFDHRTGE